MENQKQDTSVPTPSKRNIKLCILAFCFVILLAGVFYLGSYYSCMGNGELIGLKCTDIKVMGACKIDGELYKIKQEEVIDWTTIRQDPNSTVG